MTDAEPPPDDPTADSAHSADSAEPPEWDVWNAPDEAVDQLYPQTRKLLIRLRRWQWYFRVVTYLPVLVWGTFLIWLITRGPITPLDWVGVAVVVTAMLLMWRSLVGAGILLRLWGYALSALVALVGGLLGCLLGILLAITSASSLSNPTPPAGTTGSTGGDILLYLLAASGIGMLSLIAMLHIILLIIVTVRLRALQMMEFGKEVGKLGIRAYVQVKQRMAAAEAAVAAQEAATAASTATDDSTPPAPPTEPPAPDNPSTPA